MFRVGVDVLMNVGTIVGIAVEFTNKPKRYASKPTFTVARRIEETISAKADKNTLLKSC